MDFSSQLQTVSEETLNALFSEDASAPKADTTDTPPAVPQPLQTKIKEEFDIPFIDEVGDSGEVVIKKEEVVDTEKKEEDKKEDTTPQAAVSDEVKSVLKNTTDFLIEKGIWSDFEGREDLELDEEVYAQLAQKQAESQVNDLFNELVDSTGDYGRAIIAHIKNGGNPDEIIDIFKEQKQVENLDITKANNAEGLIEKYYSEVVGWSDVKIKRYVDSLKADEDGIKTEATEVQQKFEELYAEELKKVSQQQLKEKKQQEEDNTKYLSSLSETIDSFEDFTDEDKKIVKNSVFKATKKINGVPVNEFFAKFYEIQKDPKKYVELIHFVMAPDRYKGKLESKEQKKATAKQWNFVKGNAAVKNTNSQTNPRDAAKASKLDFSGIVFNKK